MPADADPVAAPVAFARLLRRQGLDVSTPAIAAFAAALTVVDVEQRAPVYWAGRSTLTRRPEDVAAFDAAFDAFWSGVDRRAALPSETVAVTVAFDAATDPTDEAQAGADPESDRPTLSVRFSSLETLRDKDFAACTTHERAELYHAITRLRLLGATRRSRRLAGSPSRGRLPDPRRTLRAALRTGGEPIRLPTRAPVDKPRPIVLLVDVSGSMEPYARALLRFAHAAVAAGGGDRRVEAFTLGTRLTRVTRALAGHDPDAALAAAADEVADWSGGTRLGDTLATFNDRWGVRGMARGALVVILSDGWDRGDPATMAEQMQRLGRVAHRVVWVNPLKSGPGYAPVVRGMAAALPHVDDFVEGHSLAALEALVDLLDAGRPAA